MADSSNSLMIPDHDAWHEDAGYSSTVAQALRSAYAAIKCRSGDTSSYETAWEHVYPRRHMAMCGQQRLHVYFVLALASAAFREYGDALDLGDNALLLAIDLGNEPAQIELLLQRARLDRAVLDFNNASDDLHTCIDIMNEGNHGAENWSGISRTTILSQLATSQFFLGQFTEAQTLVNQSREVALREPHDDLDLASAEWVQAYIYLLQRQPARALHHALGVWEVFSQAATPVSQDRIETFVALAALAEAESHHAGTDRNAFITLARPHLKCAEKLAQANYDSPGVGLAHLARAYYARLADSSIDRIALIESVIRLARRVDDPALLGQALTCLGDELEAREQTDAAINCYANALTVLTQCNISALGIPARRAIMLQHEMRPDP